MAPRVVYYDAILDDGVILTIALESERNGPAIQPTLDNGMNLRVEIPGTICAIHAPRIITNGINWSEMARSLRAILVLPPIEPKNPRPKRRKRDHRQAELELDTTS